MACSTAFKPSQKPRINPVSQSTPYVLLDGSSSTKSAASPSLTLGITLPPSFLTPDIPVLLEYAAGQAGLLFQMRDPWSLETHWSAKFSDPPARTTVLQIFTVPYATITGLAASIASIAAVLIPSKNLCSEIPSNQRQIHLMLPVFKAVLHPFHHHVIIDLQIIQLQVYHEGASCPNPDIPQYAR